MHRLITYRLIPALACFLLCISNTQAQTQQAIGSGGISAVSQYQYNHTITEGNFGSSIADMGDINGDGVDDLAVGASRLTLHLDSNLNFAGAIYILLMNNDGTVNRHILIAHGTMGLQLPQNGQFGISAANIGDFDGDGINELAVGTLSNKIYILYLTASGGLARFSTLDYSDINNILGENSLDNNDRFGISIANLGDIDGDGIIDLAVGAHRDDSSGSVHILFMDKTKTDPIRPIIKAAIKINIGNLDIADGDQFGISVANIGDLNQDGINDLAVGALGNDGNHGNEQGAVHILLLNRDGSIKPGGFEIFDTFYTGGNIFNLNAGDNAGRSIANLEDLNGDGINDIAIGAFGVDSDAVNNTGAVFTVFMKRTKNQITADDIVRITHNAPPSNTDDRFGTAIANIGDRNGDGINDIAVGAINKDIRHDNAGILYILNMDAETVITNVTATAENGRHDTTYVINIQLIFSEAVDVDTSRGTPTLNLETGTADTNVNYTSGSGSDTLIFAYTVANTDTATDLDYVDTTSLSLNGGTIIATEAPNSPALLTLPAPGSRGSLSANKNLSINVAAPPNTAPTGPAQLSDLEVTVGTSFTYTIPAGTFIDNENDRLSYNGTFPDWLSLDFDTGTLSGAPVTMQDITEYTYTISDDELSITANINITVNPAPTLPSIDNQIVGPNQSISITLPQATGGTGDYSYTLSPAGLVFNAETRMVTGTAPATEQTRTYTYTAEDENGARAVQLLTIMIKPLQALNSISDKTYSIGNPINDQLPAAIGGTRPIRYTLTPQLPEGLTFSTPTRTISGMLQKAGQSTEYTYTVTDSSSPPIVELTKFSIMFIAETISSSLAKWNGHIFNVIKYAQEITPNIPENTQFGRSITDIGDIDGNGTNDLAVGAPGLQTNIRDNAGGVYILLMNEDNTFNSKRINHGSADLQLPASTFFGTSVANIGDFDNDGINELAVGATAGTIYILHLTNTGELKRFSTIDFNDINTILGNNNLDSNDKLGISIANLGDIDGDGIIDLAVGAHKDGTAGSVHILFMDKTGTDPTLKSAIKINTADIDLANDDQFGASVANIGDLNQDGINDLAVGAVSNDEPGRTNQGAVHILLLNRDGSIKSGGFEIFNTDGNIFGLNSNDVAGISVANLGDLNGDGINDIAVGALGVDSAPTIDTGAIFTTFMKRTANQITADDIMKINGNSHASLNLSRDDLFGSSVANIGDRNGDGINDIAVGAPDDNTATSNAGALYILHLDAETVITAITATAENGRHDLGAIINIQVIFSEAVNVDASGGTPSLIMETGTADTNVNYTSGSGSDTLIFAYTVANTDTATDLDYVSTASLTLNDGTINTVEAPSHPALLTLPKPGSRGSLSSNKNLSINTEAITNKAPTGPPQLPDKALTLNTSFTYTIPADAFIDNENDPLTYTASNLPDWLSFKPITRTFSGTPETTQVFSIPLTISDGEFSLLSAISIIVNPAPTLPDIDDKNYSPSQSISTILPQATGGTEPFTYTLLPVLPSSLTFDTMTRTITGTTPATEQTRTYTYTAEDENGALAVQLFTIMIKPLQALNSISDKTYSIGNPINDQLPAAIGGARPIRYTLTPQLPEGLTFSTPTRTISGILQKAGQSTEYTYAATDSSSPPAVASTKFSIMFIAETISSSLAKWNGHIFNVIKYAQEITPNIRENTQFGRSITDIGDIDGNGTNDLAVGAPGLQINIRDNAGGVYILLMNEDNTFNSKRISHGSADLQLPASTFFGTSVANIGDFDNDGINELAVGATAGTIYILHLTNTGELKRFSTIDFNDINTILGNNNLDSNDRLGISIANLGDIDGDGIIDLAVGTHKDGIAGSVHILFMDKTGTDSTLKSVIKINTADIGLANDDQFGASVANIGDLNQDGINDLAVGAVSNDEPGRADQGAVHILLLNRDGSIKSGGFEIFNTDGNIFGLNADDAAGISVANLGDLNGDGINDIAVGALGVDSAPTIDTGAIFTTFMKRTTNQITADDIVKINGNSHASLNLSRNDLFGSSVANIGDRNGDGINDIAVGAPDDNTATSNAGALYILHLDAETVITAVTATAENGRHGIGAIINIQVIFSEPVNVDASGGTPSLILETGTTDTEAIYTDGSGSNILVFEYTVVAGNSATDLDYVSTASLTLNAGTINAVEAPSHPALLTLPEPGSRGSLSSNKNLSINTEAITNKAPTGPPQLPDKALTLNTSFTYTIPTDAFIDNENDPLTYTASNLPDWLSFNPITRTFSGTPETVQVFSIPLTISDGEFSLLSAISIIVNPAPTLPDIDDKNYSPSQSISTILPEASEGTEPFTYTLLPVLPSSLTFDTMTRTITGTAPATEQIQKYTYTAEDENGARAVQLFTITINPLQALNSIPNKKYLIGNIINDQLPATVGGTGPITYTLSPPLPNGLIFSTPTRMISGILEKTERSAEYTYTATDSSSPVANVVSTSFFITIVVETISSSLAKGNGHISDIIKYDQSNFPSISTNSRFGNSVTNMGDIDDNGTDDLAVGAPEYGQNTGAVYILLMNADDTIASHIVIKNNTSATGSDCAAGAITLDINNYFGVSLANIGDFDKDGINELAVGVLNNRIHILHLTNTGELDCFSTIAYNDINNILGNNGLGNNGLDHNDGFGVSLANLGDIDGDGIIDLAVGAHQDDSRGSIHILFMNEIGNSPALKTAIKLNAAVGLNDQFGISVAGIGDFNQDRINDLAVGAIGHDGLGGHNQGAVHVLLLNRDGSIKSGGFEIFDTSGNIFDLNLNDQAGRSITNLGDLNRDGINDIAAGVFGFDGASIRNTGAVFTMFMKRTKNQITADDIVRITHNTHPDLTLSAQDIFGTSIANIGDRNGDGISDIAVGATGANGTDPGSNKTGALYILYMDAETVITAVTATADDETHNTGAMLNIQVIFSEPVNVDTTGGTPTLTLETGTTDTEAIYTDGSGSNILTFDYTVVAGNSATDLDYVSTASLTLNGGTINATEAPSHPALLTLPKPGSRGSLSSNRNLLINTEIVITNTAAITNTTPTASGQIPEQRLTVGIPFTYTIPAGTFIDAENDPLTYTLSALSDWLSLDPDTGTFSGTPTIMQTSTQYDYTISDGEFSLLSAISIIVNPAPTLPTISDETYSSGQSRSIELPEADGGTRNITYTLSPADLPGNLMFNATARTITGAAPTIEQTKQYTYTAEDENGALAVQPFTITINPLQALNSISDKTYLIGNIINDQLPAAIGGTEPITYTLSPPLPNGLIFSTPTRMISGILEKTERSAEYTYTATDSSSPPAVVSTSFFITIVVETINSSLAKGNGHISDIIKYDQSNFPSISTNSRFGNSVTNMGDIDDNGTDDLAVGAPEDGQNTGAVYILLMNADDTIASHTVIKNGTSATGSGCATSNIALTTNNYFGVSLANIGDFDKDGINELAVGVLNNRIHILHLTNTGELDCFSTIAYNDINNILGEDSLDHNDGFGVSLANLGDIDGDGIIDLAVGAHQDDSKGSIHILFMNEIGNSPALKTAIKLNAAVGLNDQFGISVAGIGDFNQDRINDLAVGAIGNDGLGGHNQGAVHVLLLNRDGSIKSGGFEIFDTSGNIFDLNLNDQAGRAITNLGDLNRDGINDIAAGVFGFDGASIRNTGAVFTMFMKRTKNQITADDIVRITHNTHPDLTLSAEDIFGTSIANIGDRNGDGISDIAVGATGANGTDPGSNKTGALYILYMDAETVITAVTATADGRHNTGAMLNIQVIFSEPVDVDTTGGTPTLTLETGTTDTEAIYTDGSGSNILTFDYTVVAGNSATDLDYVSTASLTLNGGTINATEAPGSSALLTLPEPGSRGSLSSNRNLLINTGIVITNTAAITNTTPTAPGQIPEQSLTVGIPFTYTIPAGTFIDAENDPLTYTLSALSDWLSLDPDTGTFSGTPTIMQTSTQYDYTISDGEFSLLSAISIIVNPAPTLPIISDQNYVADKVISTLTLPDADGGTGDITYTLSPAGLPNGLMFDAIARTITGTAPATEQTRTYTYTAEDENGALAAQIFNINIILNLKLRIKVFLEGAQ